jgi:predicted ATP-dependent endonuclease of OLD family
MLLTHIDIRNFRCFRDFTFFPRRGINLVLGENNSGKTAILEAVDMALGRGLPNFELEDLHLSSPDEDPRKAPPIQIDLRFEPEPDQSFSVAFATDFVDEIDLDPVTGAAFVRYRVEGAFDQQLDRIQVSYFVLKSNGSTLALNARKRARFKVNPAS